MTQRHRLPDRRRGETIEFYHDCHGYTLTIGHYRGGRVGEVFLNAHKSGGALESVARDAAIVVSIALQHGADLGTIRRALTRVHFAPRADLARHGSAFRSG